MLPPELLDIVSKAGAVAAPIFLFLWWDERGQRLGLQTRMDALSERTITAMVEFKALLQNVVEILNGRRQ